VLDQYQQQKNETPVDEFHGLSSGQMHRFLHMPFASPELIVFPEILEHDPECEALFLLSLLMEGAEGGGIKLTATGNLGQKFCQHAFEDYQARYPDPYGLKIAIRSETSFESLHAIRLTAQLAGLVRKYKGRLLLTKKCKKALNSNGYRELYPLLLRAYIRKFNWGYRDGFQEIPFIQQSFLFTLYLLHTYGNKWKPATFYSDCYLQAFPLILQEIEPKPYEPPEDTLQHGYILRTLERFADFFGLADLEQISEGPIKREYRVRGTGLLNEIVQWHC